MLSSIQRLIDLGGPVVVILLALSVLGLAIIIYKVFQLRRFTRARFVEVERQIAPRGAPAEISGSPLGELVAFATSEIEQDKSRDVVEAELNRRGTRLVGECSRLLRALEVIAYLSPLLGLLGTVLGMIDAFRGLEFERNAGDAGTLAGGIWEALLTTALGLGIAIPMTAAHALFEAQVQGIAERLEDLLQRMLNG